MFIYAVDRDKIRRTAVTEAVVDMGVDVEQTAKYFKFKSKTKTKLADWVVFNFSEAELDESLLVGKIKEIEDEIN